ncbi:t-SNARE syntaxin TLG2 [Sporobolomyces koalae]|uniref:t-SNARE syntaxin TLG2 n=1 Tax=Sporobolomyces koalae TaxID=500713 RepID=UPI00317AA6EE
MATRSRTNLFLSYRDSAIRPTSYSASSTSTPYLAYAPDDDAAENARLMPDGDDSDWSRRGSTWSTVSSSSASGWKGKRSANDALPPPWVDLADQVDRLVERIKPKIVQLDKLHSKHLLPGFKDRTAEEREIQATATAITTDLRSCQNLIRRIAEQSQRLLQELSNPASQQARASAESRRLDLLMAANVQTALATKVQTLSTTFRQKQSQYLRLLEGNESRSTGTSYGGYSDPLVSLAEDERNSRSVLSPTSPTTPSLAQAQLFSPSLDQSEVAQRSNEISTIAQSITELADLFKDLNSLVIDQGTLLDRIDWNVEQMGREVKGAVTELQQATRYQKRSGKCQLIFLLILLIAGCLIVIAYKPSRSTRTVEAVQNPDGQGIATEEEVAQKLSEELNGARARRRVRSLDLGRYLLVDR